MNTPHKNFEDIKKNDENGFEYWEARALMPLLEYSEWRNFKGVILKAQEACNKSKQKIEYHFVDINKMIHIAAGSPKQVIRAIEDYKLSRYACYLIAQNGDPAKEAIARAQTYFAIQARRQEIFESLNGNEKRLFVRGEVRDNNKKLFVTAQKSGVTNFGKFNNAGYLGLYGLRNKQIQHKKGIGKDDILDRAGTTELAANLFRITQTDEKLVKDQISNGDKANQTHFVVGKKVRQAIKDIGGTMPENLPVEEHIREIEKQRKKLFESDKVQRIKRG
ncbi:DNA damage-inducible protein D [Candidatus Daviesbacteria bacterium]|nr:DNA damage-inducible protein D [Candidatus Daviesbacteria bacterium]